MEKGETKTFVFKIRYEFIDSLFSHSLLCFCFFFFKIRTKITLGEA